MRRRFQQVDVFTEEALRGNPVAVVLDADGLDDATMQATAAWTNLSETTFLLPPVDPGADYRVRIFTPDAELPFAGHPTLGSAHAWLASGAVPHGVEVVQECAAGLVRVRRVEGRLAFAAPPMSATDPAPDDLAAVLAALGLHSDQVLRAQVLANGPVWLALQLADAATVLALEPDHGALGRLPMVGVVGRHPSGRDALVEVRAFADAIGIPEDPVTGSLQASLAQWLVGEGELPASYVAAQGTRLGRMGRVHVGAEGDTMWIGGGTRSLVVGELDL